MAGELATAFAASLRSMIVITYLIPGGCLVLSAFLAKDGFILDDATRQLGQQFYSTVFARMEMSSAIQGLPLSLISDESVYEFEKIIC